MTSKQLQLLRFIRNKIVHTGDGPTFKEMKEFMNVTSNQTIADFLTALEREGYIQIVQGKQRGILFTQKSQEIEQEQKIDRLPPLPQSFTTFPSNASTSFSAPLQNENGTNIQFNGVVPWKKGGERNGTT